MECNKEEALRAKDIADRKMQEKDFVAARKFALKAQQLYPEAENISQMICVCDVHCAADRKIFGKELDWYGILQIAQNADDALIKKHYRKYALLLHPDKNKFAGAESAFKLIGDAQRALLDRDKRSLFDMRYRTPHRSVMPQQVSRSVHVPRQYRAPNNSRSPFSNVKDFNPSNQAPKQQGHSGAANGKETFWTLCPFCSIRYQYYKDIVDRKINCQSCKNPFIAKELQEPSVSRGSNATHPVFPGGSKVGSETTDAKSGPDPRFQRGQNVEFTRSNNGRRPRKWGDGVNKDGDMGSKSSRKGSSTRRGKKQEVESSESVETDSSINTDEVDIDVDSSRAQRRSTRNKRHVSYNENGSDDDEAMSYSKKAKENGSSSPLVEDHIGAKGGYNDVDGVDSMFQSMNENVEVDDGFVFDSSAEATADPAVYECPDPEFSDFDREREEHCFKVGQMWAVYDTIDAMPRFYAQIRKVSSPGFKLRITWLEPDPDDDDGREWVCSKLPFSCGKFKNGSSENTEDRLMFSHQVVLYNSGGRETIMIYPVKGETWAVFKNWNPKWYLIPENERKLEYEFVEILSEFNEMDGIRVAILGKLKGFASLFCRKGGSELRILPSEILRFSHRVPSYRMTGRERNDVPPGSYELDPASLTMNLEEISLPKQYFDPCTTTDFSSNSDAAYSDAMMAEKPAPSHLNNAQGNQVKHDRDGDANHRDVLNSTYFDFGAMKLLDKFQVNQVWALYSDVDGLPRCYGFIKKIDLFPIFTLHLSVLEACYLPNDSILWKDKKMPISCGQFKAKSSKRQLYTCTSSFSHQLQVDQKGQKVFSIYPQKGDVWALYKNWHPDMAYTELRQCEYDIVEVLEDDLLCFKVSILEHVDGFNSVFRPQKRGSVIVTWDIPHSEMLRFSHQIPSFRLHDEKYGNLQGSWELDRAALPLHLLRKSK